MKDVNKCDYMKISYPFVSNGKLIPKFLGDFKGIDVISMV